MAMTESDLLNVGLPKWPQMYVTGTPVTVAQAKDIIRRTDSFFTRGYGGNNHQYNSLVRKLVGMPLDYHDRPYEKFPGDDAPQEVKDAFFAKRRAENEEDRKVQEAFDRRWRPLRTSYVHNSWLSSSFIGGPYGWCHPDGEIGYVDNVGKWPSVEDVYKDWVVLAEAFPFLDIGITLYDGESCEDGTRPLVSMRVKDGKATLVDPAAEDVHASHKKATRRSDSLGSSVTEFMTNFNNPRREQGIDDEWIYEWAMEFGA